MIGSIVRAAVYLLTRQDAAVRTPPRLSNLLRRSGSRDSGGSLHKNGEALRQPGIGGRNQHFALYAATLLGQSSESTVILSAGTDGIDRNSLAAGAVVGELTLSKSVNGSYRAESNLLHQAQQALQQFDSSTLLNTVGSTIVTGATGNKLRDLRILMSQ
jgi:glycerate 2-kinase